MENILILDVGNSNTKCFIYQVDRINQVPRGVDYEATPIYEDRERTNRGHPWDLIDTCRVLLSRAIKAHAPKYGMLTAFGDAFVYYDPNQNNRPRFVFADEPVPDDITDPAPLIRGDKGGLSDYETAGFPTGNIEITGVRALRAKHKAAWKAIVPVNVFLGAELGFRKEAWRNWDITQASATGDYNIPNGEWVSDGIPVCQPYDEIGTFKDNPIAVRTPPAFQAMPLLAGGLDNAFLDTTEQTPYIVAGTWLVVSTIHDEFRPTETQRQHGVRWFISGNGRYLAQTVRRSERPLTDQRVHDIFSDFQAMGLNGGDYQKIRVTGAYAKELTAKLNRFSTGNYFNFQFTDHGEQFKQSAIYVYKHKEATME